MHRGITSIFLIFVLGLGGFSQNTVAQESAVSRAPKPKAELIDEFGKVGECDFRGRMDMFMSELSKRPDHQGYIINYLGLDTLPADREKHSRERMIVNHISFRDFDRSRITIVRGGFRHEVGTELWIVPPDGEYPSPSKTVPEPKIPSNRTFLYDKSWIASDLMNIEDEFVLESVRRQEEEELRKMDEEAKAEQQSEGAAFDGDEKESASATNDSSLDDAIAEENDSGLTSEEMENERFAWADGNYWLYLDRDIKNSGVIVFYADDERYDIHRLSAFVIEARNRMTTAAKIKPARVRVMFGGYRDSLQAEFWIVPPKGKRPIPNPEVRPEPEAKGR